MIGLMGVGNDGKTLITPKGRVLFSVPARLARIIQRIQHLISKAILRGIACNDWLSIFYKRRSE